MKFGAGKKRSNQLSSIVASLLLVVVVVLGLCSITSLGSSSPLCDEEVGRQSEAMAGGLLGAPKEVKNYENSAEIEDIAKFAVQEHNTKEGKNLTFKKVVTAKTQVVAGTMYHLTLEATHGSSEHPKVYDAKVWTKPWENHKTLEHFKESETSSSVSSDTRDASGLRAVSVEDPVIKEAAEHAIKG
ncbi:unnamed protein product [Calypogeia fissa]